jgi:hypothetical protein
MTEPISKPSEAAQETVSEPTVTPIVNVSKPTVITESLVSKVSPKTVTKNPQRVAAGLKTAQLMRQRKAERETQNVKVTGTAKLNEPWITYALGGAVIVGVILFANKYVNKKTIENVPVPRVNVVQQTNQSNLFHME